MEINLIIVLLILFTHWVADFVCQTDWQATNKSKNNKALLTHTSIYTVALFIILGLVGHMFNLEYINFKFLWFFPITFVAHTITDYFTSRLNSKLHTKGDIHNFFVSVGFDQFLHYVQLLTTYYLLS
jgi:hypothetical protein